MKEKRDGILYERQSFLIAFDIDFNTWNWAKLWWRQQRPTIFHSKHFHFHVTFHYLYLFISILTKLFKYFVIARILIHYFRKCDFSFSIWENFNWTKENEAKQKMFVSGHAIMQLSLDEWKLCVWRNVNENWTFHKYIHTLLHVSNNRRKKLFNPKKFRLSNVEIWLRCKMNDRIADKTMTGKLVNVI